jgi:Excalibur calcium-binding domain
MTGWWGVIAFFANLVALVGNLTARRRFAQLSPPEPNPAVASWLRAPIPLGPPTVRRAGVWVGAVTITFAALVAIGYNQYASTSSGGEPSSELPAPESSSPLTTLKEPITTEASEAPTDLRDLAGRCITMTDGQLDGTVSCNEPNDGRVVAITTSTDDCPASTDGYFKQGTTVACVGETSLDSSELPSGLLCRDIKARGGSYKDAVNYYISEGRPSRMDRDGNGVPCETVYSAAEVQRYLDEYGQP